MWYGGKWVVFNPPHEEQAQIRDAKAKEAALERQVVPLKEALALLDDPTPDVRRAALWMIGQRKESAQELPRKVAACLKDKNEDVRRSAAWALSRLGGLGEDAEVMSAVKEKLLYERDAALRMHLVRAVQGMRSSNTVASELLARVAKDDPDLWVRGAAQVMRLLPSSRL